MTDVIVVVNTGSSSLKFGLFDAGSDTTEPLVTGKVTDIGRRAVLDARVEGDGVAATAPLNDIPIDATHEWITAQLLDRLANGYARYRPVAAGHRVVHGGREFDAPTIIDATVRRKLESFTPLAPLHQPHNIAAVDAIAQVMPELPQVACFNTSFHRTQPRLAQLFALPRALSDDGIIRYGFHGLS
jgi:acetate kinase